MAELSFDALRRVQLMEKGNGALTPLDDAFYDSYAAFLRTQKTALKESFSLDALRLHENSAKVLRDIVDRRAAKIVLKALRDSKGGVAGLEGLARQEKSLYTTLVKLFAGYDADVGAELFSGSVPAPARAAQPSAVLAFADSVALRMLRDVPSFVSPSGVTRGPYASSALVSLPKNEAALLIKRGLAEEAGAGETTPFVGKSLQTGSDGDSATDAAATPAEETVESGEPGDNDVIEV